MPLQNGSGAQRAQTPKSFSSLLAELRPGSEAVLTQLTGPTSQDAAAAEGSQSLGLNSIDARRIYSGGSKGLHRRDSDSQKSAPHNSEWLQQEIRDLPQGGHILPLGVQVLPKRVHPLSLGLHSMPNRSQASPLEVRALPQSGLPPSLGDRDLPQEAQRSFPGILAEARAQPSSPLVIQATPEATPAGRASSSLARYRLLLLHVTSVCFVSITYIQRKS